MNRYQIIAFMIMGVFYSIYWIKMLSQKKKGIKADQVAKGKSDRKRFKVELTMKVAVSCVILVELISIFYGHSILRYSGKSIGIVVGIIGVLVFLSAVMAMGDSWRAGIAEKDRTSMIQKGIYRISRNPAFLGFDLVYIGILLMFFNWVLAFFTLWAIVMLHLQILQEEKYLPTVFGDEYRVYRQKVCRYFGRRTWKFFVPFGISIIGVCVGYYYYVTVQSSKIPEMSFEEMLQYTTKNNPDGVITVGIIKDGKVSYHVYGENGKELDTKLHTYEIGSLTKTITATCISKAIQEGKISLNDRIDRYINLPKGNVYPTIKELLTHTSGYKGTYFEFPMIYNYLIDRNIYQGVTDEMVTARLASISLSEEKYGFNYSNFGYAVLGMVLEKIYGEEYQVIINNFVKNELGLKQTAFTQDKGDLDNYWTWYDTDAFASAGALTSNIEDMLTYAKLQLEQGEAIKQTHESLEVIAGSHKRGKARGLYVDEIGMGWIIDNEHGFIWHDGGTYNYNSYLGFNKDSQTGVVILSNLPYDYRISAPLMGARLLQEIQK